MELKLRTFNAIRKFIHDKSGIYLSEGKAPLVSARLQKRLRNLGLESYEAYLELVENDFSGNELVEFLNVISTNTTYFFREPAHFDYYRELLTRMLDDGARRLRVWCAAASTGEEPYTLAMCYREVSDPAAPVDFKLLATDISTKVLNTAANGCYPKEKLKDIPGDLRYKYFSRSEDEDGIYSVDNSLRSLISFRRLNLATPPFPMRGPLDIVFCRNVMIYFDQEVKRRLINDVARLLRPGGYLFVGHSESITGLCQELRMVRPAVYVRH